jgi:GNAT superfamily N-acetyltransferase
MAATDRPNRSPSWFSPKAEDGGFRSCQAFPLKEEKHFVPDVMFRNAERRDLPSIISLLADDELGRRREILGPAPAACYVTAFEAIAADPNQRLVVAVEGDIIVGTLQITFIPGLSRKGAWRGQIEAVRIASERRGSGLGHRLFEWAIEACRARGCSLVQLTTDKSRPDAHRFYEQLGFEASHLGYKLAL